MTSYNTAFLLARFAIAATMLGHGLVRLPKLAGFSQWMVGEFKKSMLPGIMVLPFSYALPIAEFSIGVLLLVGLFTKQAIIAGAVVMIILIFGSSLIEEWGAIPSQLLHLLFFAALLTLLQYNTYALDKLL